MYQFSYFLRNRAYIFPLFYEVLKIEAGKEVFSKARLFLLFYLFDCSNNSQINKIIKTILLLNEMP